MAAVVSCLLKLVFSAISSKCNGFSASFRTLYNLLSGRESLASFSPSSVRAYNGLVFSSIWINPLF